MRLRRLLLVLTLAAAVFVVALALTFPTDAIVRSAIARLARDGGVTLAFERARLRPWGLRLDGVSLRRPDGALVAAADWVTLRPSLLAFVHDRTGRPWTIGAGACAGTIGAVVEPDGVVSVTWTDVDVARCPPLAAGASVAGLSGGRARLRLAPFAGEGEAALHAAVWKTAGRFVPGAEAIHADTASLRWSLAGDRVTLTALAFEGPELRATGTGSIDPAASAAATAIDLSLVVAPGPGASPTLRDLIGRLPPADADGGTARRLDVAGTVGAPTLARTP